MSHLEGSSPVGDKLRDVLRSIDDDELKNEEGASVQVRTVTDFDSSARMMQRQLDHITLEDFLAEFDRRYTGGGNVRKFEADVVEH